MRRDWDCIKAIMLELEGHELLDKLKSDTLWRRIVAAARDNAIELSFEAINALAKKAVEGPL